MNQSASSVVPAGDGTSVILKGSRSDTVSQLPTQVGETSQRQGEALENNGAHSTSGGEGGKTASGDATGASGKKSKSATKIDTSSKNLQQTHHRQKVATIEITVSCRNLPDISIVEKINPVAVLYLEQGSVERA